MARVLRIWLLVLLAALLPVRGAVAAAMPCPPAGTGHVQATAGHGSHHAGHADHTNPMHADAGQAQKPAYGHGHEPGASHGQKCNFCAGFCSLTPMPAACAAAAGAPDAASAAFPELVAKAPSFLSGGQERPPRTI